MLPTHQAGLPVLGVREFAVELAFHPYSRLPPVPVLQQGQDLIQLFDRRFQLADGVGGELLGLGEVIGIFE